MTRWGFREGVAVGVLTLGVLLWLVACPGRVTSRPIEDSADVLKDDQWCVTAYVHRHRIVACTADVEVCSMYQRQVRRRGGLVGVRSVSACEWVQGRGQR